MSFFAQYATRQANTIAQQVLASTPKFREQNAGVDGTARKFAPVARRLIWPLTIVEKGGLCAPQERQRAQHYLEELSEDLNMPLAIHPARCPGTKEDW